MSKEQPIYQPTGYDNSPQELVFEDSSNEQSQQSNKSEDAIDIGELGSFDNSSNESSQGSPSAISINDLDKKSNVPSKKVLYQITSQFLMSFLIHLLKFLNLHHLKSPPNYLVNL